MSNPFGDIFPDSLIKSQGSPKFREVSENYQLPNKYSRIWIFVILLIFGLGILIARLFILTVIRGKEYRILSEGNRIRETKIAAPRGIIYDRENQPIVRNIPFFLSEKGAKYYEEKPSTDSSRITESVERDYLYKNVFAHTVGFTGEVNAEDLNKKSNTQDLYEIGDRIGKTGIEKTYDKTLRGKNGKELEEVDATGNKIRVLGRIDPVPGGNIHVSLDVRLQNAAYAEMKDKKGAVVVENPNTGEILALVSTPSFDPNNFVRNEGLSILLQDSNQPLFNRAITGQYPPGSTFKIVTALAALQSHSIDTTTQIEDTGVLQVGSFTFGNWYFSQYGRKEGIVDIVKALKRSNDIFFYKTGEMTGIDTIALWAGKLGIGKQLGIDIAGEEKGLMPDPKWQKETKGENWYLGNTYHVSIGQGDVLTTPHQVNAWTNVIANGGKLCRPHLTKIQNDECKDLNIKKENIDLIREGMREACATGGTGWPLFQFKVKSEKLKVDGTDFFETFESTTSANKMVGIPVACKTGTAEYGDSKNRTHAWFTVFAPVYNPQISVTVLVEGGGEGSNVAAPIAKKILEKWFGS